MPGQHTPDWQPSNQYPAGQYQPPYAPSAAAPVPPVRKPGRKGSPAAGCLALAVLAVIVIVVIVAVTSGGGGSPSPGAAAIAKRAAATAKAKAAAKKTARAVSECYRRKPASGDVYVRTAEPGLAASAEEIGGGYAWDYSTGQCLSSVKWTLASAGQAAGECTTVGYVADNPGYDVNASPARPLARLAGEAGPGC